MELTAAAFDYILAEDLDVCHVGDHDDSLTFNRVILFDEGKIPDKTLAVSCGQSGKEGLILNIVKDVPGKKGWYILMHEKSAAEIINKVLDAFHTFVQWKESWISVEKTGPQFDRIISDSIDFLNIGILLVDDNLNRIGGRKFSYWPLEAEGQEMFSEDPTQQLYRYDPDIKDTFATTGFEFYQHWKDKGIYYKNIRYKGENIARVLFEIPDSASLTGAKQLAEYTAQRIEAVILRQYREYILEDMDIQIHNALSDLISGGTFKQNDLEQAMEMLHWKADNTYRVICLSPIGYHYSEESLHSYIRIIEETFPSCKAVILEKSIVCLRNISIEKDDGFSEKLSEFLREYMFKAAISNPFTNIYISHDYNYQAETAMEIGHDKDPDLWKYYFSAYSGIYVLRQGLAHYPLEDFCPDSLKALIAYDKEHPLAEMLKTLKVYIECRFNAARSAETLFIHRTTFFYRLDKIRQIIGKIPEEPDEILSIMMYFAMCDESCS